MANTWGTNRTGYDKQLYEIGTELQNVGTVEGVRDAVRKLEKVLEKIEKEQAVKRIEEIRQQIIAM
jgi:hypothetical protein